MNKSLRLWIQFVATLGVLVIVQSLVSLQTTPHRYEWLFFAALAILTGSFSMKIGSVYCERHHRRHVFHHHRAAVRPGAGDARDCARQLRRVVAPRPRSCSRRVQHGNDRARHLGREPRILPARGRSSAHSHLQTPPPAGQVIVPLLALTAVYFLTNSGLIAIAIGLDARRSPVAVWREHFLWLSVNYFAAASVSFCLVLLMYQSNLLAAIVFVPLLVVLHLTLRSSFGRLDDARQHLATSIACTCRPSKRSPWRSTQKTT